MSCFCLILPSDLVILEPAVPVFLACLLLPCVILEPAGPAFLTMLQAGTYTIIAMIKYKSTMKKASGGIRRYELSPYRTNLAADPPQTVFDVVRRPNQRPGQFQSTHHPPLAGHYVTVGQYTHHSSSPVTYPYPVYISRYICYHCHNYVVYYQKAR